jgi:hypothetical protein
VSQVLLDTGLCPLISEMISDDRSAANDPARIGAAKRPGANPAFSRLVAPYWAGGVAGSVGVASGVAGGVVVSAGGVVLSVVVLSAVSLHAAMPKRAIAAAEAKINFFIIVSS